VHRIKGEVIKTVPFDIVFSFIIGSGIALWFKEELRAEARVVFHPYFAVALIFECFFYLPLGFWLYYFYPAWSWMYFFDPAALEPLNLAVLGVVMVSLYLLALVAGFQLAQFLIKRGRERSAAVITICALLILGLFCLFTLKRLLWVGDFQRWNDGLATFLVKHRLAYINALMAVLGFGSLAFLLRKLKGQNFSPLA